MEPFWHAVDIVVLWFWLKPANAADSLVAWKDDKT